MADFIKLFSLSLTNKPNKLEYFVYGNLFQPNLIFENGTAPY